MVDTNLTPEEAASRAVGKLVLRSSPNSKSQIIWFPEATRTTLEGVVSSFRAEFDSGDEKYWLRVSKTQQQSQKSDATSPFGFMAALFPVYNLEVLDASGKVVDRFLSVEPIQHLFEAAARQARPSNRLIDSLLADDKAQGLR